MDHDDLVQQLENLRIQYVNSLPERMNEIKSTWQQVTNHWELTQLEELKKLCHTLAGGAATFGYPKITDLARQVELLIKDIDTDKLPSRKQKSQISIAVNRLLAESITDPVKVSKSAYQQPITQLSQRPIYIVDLDVEFTLQLKEQLHVLVDDIQIFNDLEKFELDLIKLEPCIILMDIMIAHEEPLFIDKINKIREKQLLRSSLFFMSAKEELQIRLAAYRAGGNEFFTKPIDIQLLNEKINLLLNQEMNDPYRILLVDDDKLLVQHYATIFKRVGCLVQTTSDPLLILEFLVDIKPDILLIDVHMPDCNGIELAATLRQQDAYIHLPIIFLSKEIDSHEQFRAREIGADDFLVKPIDEKYLVSAVLNRAQRIRQMRELLYRDSMTGLLNHDKLVEEVSRQIIVANRTCQSLIFVLFDLDHFKQVNDKYGHLAGDKVIKAFSNLIISRLRQSDIAGRYGGEEFGMILPETSCSLVGDMLNEIRKKFASIVHYHNQHTFKVTVSAGAAQYKPPMSAKQLIENADRQLYQAKNSGRNKVLIERLET